MSNFYALMLNFSGSPTEYHPKIEAALDAAATDWLRVGAFQYLVATALTAEQIYYTVKPVVAPGAYIVVVGANIANRSGWATQTVIDWFNKYAA